MMMRFIDVCHAIGICEVVTEALIDQLKKRRLHVQTYSSAHRTRARCRNMPKGVWHAGVEKAVLRKIRLLPRYSMKWDKALQVTNFFYEMDASDPRLKRYNQYMAGFGPTRKGIAGNVIVWSCPSNVCQAAIYALSIFK